jgi:hypothetical protein
VSDFGTYHFGAPGNNWISYLTGVHIPNDASGITESKDSDSFLEEFYLETDSRNFYEYYIEEHDITIYFDPLSVIWNEKYWTTDTFKQKHEKSNLERMSGIIVKDKNGKEDTVHYNPKAIMLDGSLLQLNWHHINQERNKVILLSSSVHQGYSSLLHKRGEELGDENRDEFNRIVRGEINKKVAWLIQNDPEIQKVIADYQEPIDKLPTAAEQKAAKEAISQTAEKWENDQKLFLLEREKRKLPDGVDSSKLDSEIAALKAYLSQQENRQGTNFNLKQNLDDFLDMQVDYQEFIKGRQAILANYGFNSNEIDARRKEMTIELNKQMIANNGALSIEALKSKAMRDERNVILPIVVEKMKEYFHAKYGWVDGGFKADRFEHGVYFSYEENPDAGIQVAIDEVLEKMEGGNWLNRLHNDVMHDAEKGRQDLIPDFRDHTPSGGGSSSSGSDWGCLGCLPVIVAAFIGLGGMAYTPFWFYQNCVAKTCLPKVQPVQQQIEQIKAPSIKP